MPSETPDRPPYPACRPCLKPPNRPNPPFYKLYPISCLFQDTPTLECQTARNGQTPHPSKGIKMKLLTTAILSSAIALSSMAAAAGTDNPTVAKKTVSYVCQQGKKVKVTYGFNKQGLTTYASAVINGKRVQMPVNLDKSDNVETFYGKEGGYVLGTGVMDGKSYRKQPIMITAPDNQIVFKDCSPR
ncbi:adhesin component [Neisseria meningitidis 053442]|nr:adhesin component [Neisseria meningitidis 053442]